MADDMLEALVQAVQAKPSYSQIDPDLVRWLGQQEISRRRSLKEAIKHTRARLHQVASAYQDSNLDYSLWEAALQDQSHDLTNPGLQAVCKQMMRQHASTRERLPILEEFFSQILGAFTPLQSILDIGCGMNALALPWMPVNAQTRYIGLDIFADMATFLNVFLNHVQNPGEVRVYNLVNGLPLNLPSTQVALLLKTVPCLEQLDRKMTSRLLDSLHAEILLVSYPLHSLGGRSKGMLANYEKHFSELADSRGWQAKEFVFSTELAYLIEL